MEVRRLHAWPATPAEATAIQDRLRPLLDLTGPGPQALTTVAGLDVSYAGTGAGPGAGIGDRLVAAVVVLDAATLRVVEQVTAEGTASFPYVPGLFAFRELPTLVEALEKLTITPDLLVCDGHGLAHPRRFGLACHLGVLTGLPTIGVAKNRFVGACEEPGPARGASSPLVDGGEIVGRALRTRPGVKPVFVSVGHGIDLDNACRHVLALSPRYRLPETTRQADRLSRVLLTGTGTT